MHPTGYVSYFLTRGQKQIRFLNGILSSFWIPDDGRSPKTQQFRVIYDPSFKFWIFLNEAQVSNPYFYWPSVKVQAPRSRSESDRLSAQLLSGLTFLTPRDMHCYLSLHLSFPCGSALPTTCQLFWCVSYTKRLFRCAQHVFTTWCKIYISEQFLS
jgi:hypothetical protein